MIHDKSATFQGRRGQCLGPRPAVMATFPQFALGNSQRELSPLASGFDSQGVATRRRSIGQFLSRCRPFDRYRALDEPRLGLAALDQAVQAFADP